jgi:uncharacterized membrane protein
VTAGGKPVVAHFDQLKITCMTWIQELFPGIDGVANLHPLFIHFPIVLLPVAGLLHFLPKAEGWSWTAPAARWSLWLGTASALIAIASGYLAADSLGHDSLGHDFVHIHRNFMVATGIVAVAVSTVAAVLRNRSDATSRWIIGVGLIALSCVLMLGSDRGATLVYRYGMGVQTSQPNHAPTMDSMPTTAPDDEHEHSH